MEREPFNHADPKEWSMFRLIQRIDDLEETLKVRHNEGRLGDIALELACVRYEVDKRIEESRVDGKES